MHRVWVIRNTPYRETSLLVSVLAESDQLLRAVARGGGKGAHRFEPFQPFFVDLKGAPGALNRVHKHESAGARLPLHGVALMAGLYLNEISQYLLPEALEVDGLFMSYTHALSTLAVNQTEGLRRYERLILEAAGHYPLLTEDSRGQALEPDQQYRLLHGQQLVAVESTASDSLSGADWIGLAQSRYDEPTTARQSKWLHRMLVDQAIGGRRLLSRELLQTKGR